MFFDRRGTGLSDRMAVLVTYEEMMDDVRAVMDAVGSERAALFGMVEGGPMVHSVGGAAVLIVIMVLNLYKPQGLTRYGWRKQQEQRGTLQRNKQDEQQVLRP